MSAIGTKRTCKCTAHVRFDPKRTWRDRRNLRKIGLRVTPPERLHAAKRCRRKAGERARTAKSKACKAPIAGVSVTSLQEQVAALTRELKEAQEQQSATGDVLKVISGSFGQLEPVFDAMLLNAVRLCEASYGAMWLREGGGFRNAAFHGALPEAYTGQWRRGMVTPAG